VGRLILIYRPMIYDVAIIGAGIAGAGVAASIANTARTVLLEAEERPGYHTTGRSAAFYAESYGGHKVQPLTKASKDWYFKTISPLSETLMVKKRGAVHVNWQDGENALDSFLGALKPLSQSLNKVDAAQCEALCTLIAAGDVKGGVYDPDCCDIDVDGVHQFFLRTAKHDGCGFVYDFSVDTVVRSNGVWVLTSSRGETLRAKTLVNAAGAWADDVARRAGVGPLGLVPKRRTVGVFELLGHPVSPEWPLVLDLGERFYFKPEGQHLLLSPADETPSEPCDAQPEMEDIARAVDRFERATGYRLGRCSAKWAGLRTFAADRCPVFGFDQDVPDFFWCAGQGGFGIQTAPAAATLCGALLLNTDLPHSFEACEITASTYAPQRFSAAA